jgi:hypothetical protein
MATAVYGNSENGIACAQEASGFCGTSTLARHLCLPQSYLWALSHKPNPIKVMTSKTTNAAVIR